MIRKIFNRDGRFLSLFRESVAILAAILVAFALDAWWEERREYAQMLDALDAVSIEIDRNLALLDEAIAYNQAQGRRGFIIVELEPEAVAGVPPEQVRDLGQIPEYDLVRLQLGAVTAFIEGGFLAVLPDRELRAEIAAIPRLQEEIDEEMVVVQEAQARLEDTMLANVSVDELIVMMQNPAEPGTTLLYSIATNDEARRALMFRSFVLAKLYTAELEEAQRLLEVTAEHVRVFSAQ